MTKLFILKRSDIIAFAESLLVVMTPLTALTLAVTYVVYMPYGAEIIYAGFAVGLGVIRLLGRPQFLLGWASGWIITVASVATLYALLLSLVGARLQEVGHGIWQTNLAAGLGGLIGAVVTALILTALIDVIGSLFATFKENKNHKATRELERHNSKVVTA